MSIIIDYFKGKNIDVLITGIAIRNGVDKIVSRDKDFLKIAKVTELKIEIY